MEEIFSKIGFNWQLALANLANFFIIFYLLKRFAFGPIGCAIKNRQSKIEQGLENAQKAKSELVMAEQNYELKLTEARKEAQGIVAKAHTQVKFMFEKAEVDTKYKVDRIMKDAETRIAKEQHQAEVTLRARAAEVALDLSSKIIKEKIDPSKEKDLIVEILKN